MLAGSAKQTDNGGCGHKGLEPARGVLTRDWRCARRVQPSQPARQGRPSRPASRSASPPSCAPQPRHRICTRATPLELAVLRKTKAPEVRGFCRRWSVAYFGEVLIEPNLVFSVLPRLL